MASKARETTDSKHFWGGLTTRTNNSTAALQVKQSHSGEKRLYLLRAWMLYPNTKSDHELSFLNSSLPLRFLSDMRVPLHSSQRLSSTTLNSLGSCPLSDAKELAVAVSPYPWCRPYMNQGQNKCKLQHLVSIKEPGRTVQDCNDLCVFLQTDLLAQYSLHPECRRRTHVYPSLLHRPLHSAEHTFTPSYYTDHNAVCVCVTITTFLQHSS